MASLWVSGSARDSCLPRRVLATVVPLVSRAAHARRRVPGQHLHAPRTTLSRRRHRGGRRLRRSSGTGRARATPTSSCVASPRPASGSPPTPWLNVYTTAAQSRATVDMAADGSFVVAWTSAGRTAMQWRLRPTPRRGGDASCHGVSGEHRHQNSQYEPGAGGRRRRRLRRGLVRVHGLDHVPDRRFGQRFDSAGTKLGGEILLKPARMTSTSSLPSGWVEAATSSWSGRATAGKRS